MGWQSEASIHPVISVGAWGLSLPPSSASYAPRYSEPQLPFAAQCWSQENTFLKVALISASAGAARGGQAGACYSHLEIYPHKGPGSCCLTPHPTSCPHIFTSWGTWGLMCTHLSIWARFDPRSSLSLRLLRSLWDQLFRGPAC